MKELSKVKGYLKDTFSSALFERYILSKLNHPLIVHLYYSFQDYENLYLVIDYFPGGDLNHYLHKDINFSEAQIKFFVANIILSLNYIHKMNIIHRDLKPANLAFDSRGYLHLIDFGIAKKIKKGKNILDKTGTLGYFGPEIFLKKPQNFSSDFFSLGVICYKLIFHRTPFHGQDDKETKEKVLYKKIKLNEDNIPEGFSSQICDFINRLLKKNQSHRLGYENINDIKQHEWLKDVDWDKIENKTVLSEKIPFIPSLSDNFYCSNKNCNNDISMDRYDEILRKINESEIFKNFYFNYITSNLLPDNKIKDINHISRIKNPNRSENDKLNNDDETNCENNENNSDINIMKNTGEVL